MRKIRVLLVDDAVVVRRLVSDVLAQDAELEVVGTAANGQIALSKLGLVQPDVVVLDVEMPEMDGLQTLAAIRKTHKLLPVIMFSTLTQRGAEATLDALALGASDYVAKPANVGSVNAAMQTVRETLIPKIKLFCRRAAGLPPPAAAGALPSPAILPAPAPTMPRAPIGAGGARVDIVAVGCSTGGPEALNVLLPALPRDFAVPVVIVQHMPPMFTRLLAERLDSRCALRVREATSEPVELRPGDVWVAPGDFHLSVQEVGGTRSTRVFTAPPENSCRPAADVLFRSVAQLYGARALAVVLTGMGQDGFRGCEAICAAGGAALAQDEATSVVWGMPGFVAQAGLASRVLPLPQIAGEIVRRVQFGRVAGLAAAGRAA